MLVKTCPICGKAFETEQHGMKYCSDKCREEGKRIWQSQHPHYNRDMSRKRRGTVEYNKTCIICGRPFKTTLPHQLTCSKECSVEHSHGRKRRTPEQEHERYIRRKYGTEAKRIEYLEEKERQAERDRIKRAEAQKAEKKSRMLHKGCVVCGKEFETYNPKQRTCCAECSRKLRNARKQRRIPQSQMIDKDITLEALFKRDSGVCYLCGGQCDWADKNGQIVGDMYPSIDHVIPVAAGGLHSWSNVRLAHFRCNVNKSDKLLPHVSVIEPDIAYKYKRDVRLHKKRTEQMSKNGTTIAIYDSTVEASRATGIRAKGIQNCARGEIKSYGGYVWRYV